MTLWEMSLSGGILILAILVLRALTLHRLPKQTFPALWTLTLARLLIPFSLPSPLSVWSLAQSTVLSEGTAARLTAPTPPLNPPPLPPSQAGPAAPSAAGTDFPILTAVWLAGATLCTLFFLASYLRCRRIFRFARPVASEQAARWLKAHPLRRRIALRESERIAAPLTYGVLHPVILLPASIDWQDLDSMAYVLEHEHIHIRRFDGVLKLLLTAAVCIHWFNPAVWAMLTLADRDIELSCDEEVVRRFGLERRSSYARTLIAMEERKSGLSPFASAFSKNAIEERIAAIMKIKKPSLPALVLAIALVFTLGAAFATSSQAKDGTELRPYLTRLPDDDFTEAESQRIFSLWFEGYRNLTVADYREKMRSARTDADMELIERFSLDEAAYQLPSGKEADALTAFNDYFFNVYEPLTADQWQIRSFDGFGADEAEYQYNLVILDPRTLKVGEYEAARLAVDTALRQPMDDASDAFAVEKLGTPALRIELGYYSAPFCKDNPDAGIYTQNSEESAAEWDRLLAPYLPFGLTWEFIDPDHDGNGLNMRFDGKAVRGIFDEQEGIWITEHAGNNWPKDAVELYTVYTDGKLSGLREASEEEQAAFTETRTQNSEAREFSRNAETREFPQATRADYDSFLTLRQAEDANTGDALNLPLEEFNQRLLDWANANQDAYNRISCDVLWDDYGVYLTTDERAFVSVTCRLSGTENGMKVRALYTGDPEQDPGFSANLPSRSVEMDSGTAAWCDLYYDISYHIPDKAKVTAAKRDACVNGMIDAIQTFWQDTDIDSLLGMTEANMVKQFNLYAKQYSGNGVTILPVTEDNIHFEHMDERDIYNEARHAS